MREAENRVYQHLSSAPTGIRTQTWRILSPNPLSDQGSCIASRRSIRTANPLVLSVQKRPKRSIGGCGSRLPISTSCPANVDVMWTQHRTRPVADNQRLPFPQFVRSLLA
jgi:hypothetical protein